MNKIKNFEPHKFASAREKLPVGGYVCKIKTAKVEENEYGQKLAVAFDIIEGDYKEFFQRDYDSNINPDKKWRGTLRINVPSESEIEKDSWKANALSNFVACVEESNTGYHWDWDETKLKGKVVGVLFRNREWEMNGQTGWTAEAAGSATVSDIREKKFKLPKDKPLKVRPEEKKQSTGTSFQVETEDDDDSLPF